MELHQEKVERDLRSEGNALNSNIRRLSYDMMQGTPYEGSIQSGQQNVKESDLKYFVDIN